MQEKLAKTLSHCCNSTLRKKKSLFTIQFSFNTWQFDKRLKAAGMKMVKVWAFGTFSRWMSPISLTEKQAKLYTSSTIKTQMNFEFFLTNWGISAEQKKYIQNWSFCTLLVASPTKKLIKGQLISKCVLLVSSFQPKYQRNFLKDFCPSLSKEVK